MEYLYDDFIAWMKKQPQRNNPNNKVPPKVKTRIF